MRFLLPQFYSSIDTLLYKRFPISFPYKFQGTEHFAILCNYNGNMTDVTLPSMKSDNKSLFYLMDLVQYP